MSRYTLATLEGEYSHSLDGRGFDWEDVKRISKKTVKAVNSVSKKAGQAANYVYEKTGLEWAAEKTGTEYVFKKIGDVAKWMENITKRKLFNFVSGMVKKQLAKRAPDWIERTSTPKIAAAIEPFVQGPAIAFLLTLPGGQILAPAGAILIHQMIITSIDQLKKAIKNVGMKVLGLNESELKEMTSDGKNSKLLPSPQDVVNLQWSAYMVSLKNGDSLIIGPNIRTLIGQPIKVWNGKIYLTRPAGPFGKIIEHSHPSDEEWLLDYNLHNNKSLKWSPNTGTVFSVAPASIAAAMQAHYEKKKNANGFVIPALAAVALMALG